MCVFYVVTYCIFYARYSVVHSTTTLKEQYIRLACMMTSHAYMSPYCCSILVNPGVFLSRVTFDDLIFSYTLSREYRVMRNRYSPLLFTSEDRLCTNLRVQDNRRIRRHNASISRSRGVTMLSQ